MSKSIDKVYEESTDKNDWLYEVLVGNVDEGLRNELLKLVDYMSQWAYDKRCLSDGKIIRENINPKIYDSVEVTNEQINELINKMKDAGVGLINLDSVIEEMPLPVFRLVYDSMEIVYLGIDKEKSRLVTADDTKTWFDCVLDAYVVFSELQTKAATNTYFKIGRICIMGQEQQEKALKIHTEVCSAMPDDIRKSLYPQMQAVGILILRIYLAVQFAIANRPEVLIEKSASEAYYYERDPKNPKKRPRRKVKLVKVSYLGDLSKVKSHRKYTCECWGVIGHERHYKNGKTVFIKPYKKGPKRDDPGAYSPKTYDVV